MKKFLMILTFAIIAMAGFSQKDVPSVATDGVGLTAGKFVSIWGTSADTLINADTLTYTLRIKGDQTFDIKSQVYIDFVSGEAAYKVYTYNSMDGVNWTAKTADSLTITAITADQLYGTALSFTDVMDTYKRIQIIQSGTAVTVPKQYFVTRKN